MKRQRVNLRREFATNPARFLTIANPKPALALSSPAEVQPAWQSLPERPCVDGQPDPLADELRRLGLDGMARALAQLRTERNKNLPRFDEWLGTLVAGEVTHRARRRVTNRLRAAGLRYHAPLADVDYGALRGFDDGLFHWLATGRWISDKDNLLIDGPTGVGKTWLACALGEQACRDDRSVRYECVPRLLAELDAVRGKAPYARRMKALHRVELLILDDWGVAPFAAAHRPHLLELIDGRYGRGSTLIASPVAVECWPQLIDDPTLASEILDRLVHNAHRLQLRGESLRETRKAVPNARSALPEAAA